MSGRDRKSVCVCMCGFTGSVKGNEETADFNSSAQFFNSLKSVIRKMVILASQLA